MTLGLGHGPGALALCSTFSRHASTRFRLPMCSARKEQQMLRAPNGCPYLLQIRTRVLNPQLRRVSSAGTRGSNQFLLQSVWRRSPRNGQLSNLGLGRN